MSIRCTVIPTPDFFRILDAQLPAERNGATPSRHDFLAWVLPEIVERFATGWDDLPPRHIGRTTYREAIVTGRLVPYVAVLGQMTASGVVELIEVLVDLEGLDDPEAPDA